MGYGEHWKFHRNSGVLGAWWRKLTPFRRQGSERVLYIEDYRDTEITKEELPAGAYAAIWPLLEESLKLGFRDLRFGGYLDPFTRREIASVYAVHPETFAVLRISRKRDVDDRHPMELEIVISTVFADGSVLVTTNDRPRLRTPVKEKQHVKKNGGPRELWLRHTKVLAGIQSVPKPTPNADAAWALTNEVEAERARFHLARGFYVKRSLDKCADDAERLLQRYESSLRAESRRAGWNSLFGSFFGMPQLRLSGAVAVAIAICVASSDAQPANSMPPLTASQKRRLAQKSQVNAQARLTRTAAADIRESR